MNLQKIGSIEIYCMPVEINHEWYVSEKEAQFLDENEYEIIQINIENLYT